MQPSYISFKSFNDELCEFCDFTFGEINDEQCDIKELQNVFYMEC